jgi:hypothetical protein
MPSLSLCSFRSLADCIWLGAEKYDHKHNVEAESNKANIVSQRHSARQELAPHQEHNRETDPYQRMKPTYYNQLKASHLGRDFAIGSSIDIM